MKTFNEYYKNRLLTEESKEERIIRGQEAEKRALKFSDYVAQSKMHKQWKPAGSVGPDPSSPSWRRWASEHPESPTDDFRDAVEEEIYKQTGKSWMMGSLTDSQTEKGQSDTDRVSDLIEDCFDDGTSIEETVKMVLELVKSMGYL